MVIFIIYIPIIIVIIRPNVFGLLGASHNLPICPVIATFQSFSENFKPCKSAHKHLRYCKFSKKLQYFQCLWTDFQNLKYLRKLWKVALSCRIFAWLFIRLYAL